VRIDVKDSCKNVTFLVSKVELQGLLPLGFFGCFFHFVNANFPRLLDLDRFAYLGWDRPAFALGLAAAYLLGLLFAFLHQRILALLLRDWNALLLLFDAADLLGKLLARLVAAFGLRNFNLLADLGPGLADILLNLLADLLGLIDALLFQDGSAGFLFVTLVVLLEDLLEELFDDGPLPLLVGFDLLGVGALLDQFALGFLNLLANFLGGGVTLVLPDGLAHLRCVTLGLELGNAIGPAPLFNLHLAEGNRNLDALVDFDQLALFGCSLMTFFIPDSLAIVNGLVLALVVVLGPTNLVSNFVDDMGTLKLFSLVEFRLGIFLE